MKAKDLPSTSSKKNEVHPTSGKYVKLDPTKGGIRYDHSPVGWNPMLWLWLLLRKISAERWLTWPRPLGVAYLAVKQYVLRAYNIKQTELVPGEALCGSTDHRNITGVCNNLNDGRVGASGQPFGRNTYAVPENMKQIGTPSPDLIADTLLARKKFQSADGVNLFVAAWIQFLIHDLLDHDDDTQCPMMTVGKQSLYKTKTVDGRPNLYLNRIDAFVDGSPMYGDNKKLVDDLRQPDGKIRLPDNYLPIDATTNTEELGHAKNIWFGLSMITYIFALEHNAVVDMFKKKYPDWDGDRLFNQARLVICAMIAKIHAIEWTTTIISNPTGAWAQHHMLYGFLGQTFRRKFGSQRWLGNFINGIFGGKLDYQNVNYATTEEFTSVYRMHSLLPDRFTIRDPISHRELATYELKDTLTEKSHKVNKENPRDAVVFSMGTQPPGTLTLNNFPSALRDFDDRGLVKDMACVDIIRDRERGVPRYNDFRRAFQLKPISKWSDLTKDPDQISKLQKVYGDDVEALDLLVGTLAEPKLPSFIFGETIYTVFVVQTQRRLECDRFFTDDYRKEIYTQEGMDWVEYNTFASMLRRHFPAVRDYIKDSDNAFFAWKT